MYELSRSPQQILEDHADPGTFVTYTNTSSCQIVITGVVWALNGAPGDNAYLSINAAVVQYLVIPTGDAFVSQAFNAEIILGPTDTITVTNTSAIGTAGFVISGWLYNANG